MISSSEVWLVPSNIANEKDLYISRKWKLVFFPLERDHTGLFAGLQTSPLVLWTVICIFTCFNLKLNFLLMHILHAITLINTRYFQNHKQKTWEAKQKTQTQAENKRARTADQQRPATAGFQPVLGQKLVPAARASHRLTSLRHRESPATGTSGRSCPSTVLLKP